MTADQEIYFHVGLGKVASTYLQQCVFPRLEGIHYIPTRQYRKSMAIIPKLQAKKILVSREFDRQFEQEVRWFTSTYPQVRIIVILRRHDAWIASQYRRHVKNGWFYEFKQFFDLEGDQGYWKHEDVLYYPRLRVIEETCKHKPLVLFHDELVNDPWAFFNKIAAYTGTGYSQSRISLRSVHTSYGEKQLSVLRSFCKRYIRKVPQGHANKLKHWLFYRPYWALFHLIMYAANLVPDRMVSDQPLIDPSLLEQVRGMYTTDWEQVRQYAEENNPI